MHKIFSKGFFFDSSTPHDSDRTVITNRRRFDQQTRSRPLIAITASSDGSRSTSLNINTVIRYRNLPIPLSGTVIRYRIHPVPYPVPPLIRYRHQELDDGIGYWIPVMGYRYRQIPVPDDGPDDDRRILVMTSKPPFKLRPIPSFKTIAMAK